MDRTGLYVYVCVRAVAHVSVRKLKTYSSFDSANT